MTPYSEDLRSYPEVQPSTEVVVLSNKFGLEQIGGDGGDSVFMERVRANCTRETCGKLKTLCSMYGE